MKVVLVQPRIGYMDSLRSAPSLPLGLLLVAARLRERYEVELIDARVEADPEARLRGALADEPLFVGITCHTGPMIHSALQLSRVVKAAGGVPVVWGGVHASLAPEVTVADPSVDMCVIGEGEDTAYELARSLEAGQALRQVPGLMMTTAAGPHRTPPRELLPPDRWPEPAFDLVDLTHYLPHYGDRPSLSFQASRGCVCRCSYCYNEQFNRRRWRRLEPDTVLRILRRLRRRVPFEDVYFVDDNFFAEERWALAVAEGLAGLDLSWQCQGAEVSSLLRLDASTLARLRRAGLRRLSLGVESGSERVRREIGKRGSRADVLRAVERVTAAGIRIYASFMVGFPGETPAEMRQTVDLALDLTGRFEDVHCSPFYSYTPFPGTRAYDEAVAHGFGAPRSLEDWARRGGFDEYTEWGSARGPILGRDDFEALNMATLLMDRKVEDYSTSRLLRLAGWLYRPVARARARHLFFGLMPERWLLRAFYRRLSDAP